MEQPRDNPQSFLERIQRRPRARWLVETASQIATAAWEVLQEEPPAEWKPPVVFLPGPFDLSDEEWERRRHQREQEAMVRAGRLQTLLRIAPGRELDVAEYARHRQEQADWLTMEIGPGDHPSGLVSRSFKGKSAYIGIDNYSYPEYSDGADSTFKHIREARPDENIFLREDPNFGKYYPKEKYEYYDFPDATADEIYLSRVYDKPSFNIENNDEEAMTNEVARLLKPGGKALIFDYDRNLEEIVGWIKGAGLELRFVLPESSVNPETGALTWYSDELLELKKELDCTEGALVIIAEKRLDWTRSSASRIHAPFYPAP